MLASEMSAEMLMGRSGSVSGSSGVIGFGVVEVVVVVVVVGDGGLDGVVVAVVRGLDVLVVEGEMAGFVGGLVVCVGGGGGGLVGGGVVVDGMVGGGLVVGGVAAGVGGVVTGAVFACRRYLLSRNRKTLKVSRMNSDRCLMPSLKPT